MRTEPRRTVTPAIDEQRRVIHGHVTVDFATGEIHFVIPHKLEGTNAGMWGGSWHRKHHATQQWETVMKIVMGDYAGRDSITEFDPYFIRALGLPPIDGSRRSTAGKREIQITRLCPSRRNFTRDDDNDAMAQKPIVDAIKRLGLIRQDSRNWTRLRPLLQDVSPDGRWWTRAQIFIPAGEPLPFPGAL